MILVADVIQAASDVTGYAPDQLTGSSRIAPLCSARFAMMAAAGRLMDRSLCQIARATGGRNHTSVLHAIRVAEAKADLDEDYDDLILAIMAQAREIAKLRGSAATLIRLSEGLRRRGITNSVDGLDIGAKLAS